MLLTGFSISRGIDLQGPSQLPLASPNDLHVTTLSNIDVKVNAKNQRGLWETREMDTPEAVGLLVNFGRPYLFVGAKEKYRSSLQVHACLIQVALNKGLHQTSTRWRVLYLNFAFGCFTLQHSQLLRCTFMKCSWNISRAQNTPWWWEIDLGAQTLQLVYRKHEVTDLVWPPTFQTRHMHSNNSPREANSGD